MQLFISFGQEQAGLPPPFQNGCRTIYPQFNEPRQEGKRLLNDCG